MRWVLLFLLVLRVISFPTSFSSLFSVLAPRSVPPFFVFPMKPAVDGDDVVELAFKTGFEFW